MELLHEAAFGKNPLGSGLGNSLFASADRVGSYSFEQIEGFHQHFFTPTNCSVALSGLHSEQDGIALLREIKTNLHVRAPQKVPDKVGKTHGFVGGDLRRDVAAAPRVYANLAWPTSGKDEPDALAFDVAASLLSGSVGRVPYGGAPKQKLTSIPTETDIQMMAFHKSFSGHGLFGVSVSGTCASTVNEALCNVVSNLPKLQITDKDVTQAKTAHKADILMEYESSGTITVDLAIQAFNSKGNYVCPKERAAMVDAVTLAQVTEALKKASSSTVAALSVVGQGTNNVLPLRVILAR